MKFAELISKSKTKFSEQPLQINGPLINVFSSGADWMYYYLNEDILREEIPGVKTNFSFYGILKYVMALTFGIASALLLNNISVFLVPLSVIVFYFIEVHFLFLFPLLLDRVPNPLITSIKCTYKIGLLRTVLNIIPIGFYMMAGLFKFNNPFRNWYIGCLAIVIWYKDEVRNRI